MLIESTEAEGGAALHTPENGGSLVVSLEGTVVQTVPIGERVVTIGRLPQNGLVLPDTSVSRYHAEVRTPPGGMEAIITDVGSSAGTYLGQSRLLPNQPCKLEAGSMVQIGPYEITYIAPATPRTHPPTRPLTPAVEQPAVRYQDADDDTIVAVSARPHHPLAVPAVGRSRYLRSLPAPYQDNEFLGRMLQIFEAIWEPLEQRQDHVAMYFDPRTCPATFLPWLAGWLGLVLDRHWPEERRRSLLAEAMELYRWRGTHYGLTRMIEVCTGLTPIITDDTDNAFVVRITVRSPASREVRRDVLDALIRLHKPAHVGYVLEVTT